MCKLLFLFFLFFIPVYCFAKDKNNQPLFSKLISNNTKVSYNTFEHKPDPEIFHFAKIDEPSSDFIDFLPTLNDDLINKISEVKKQQETNNEELLQNNKEYANKLDSIRSELVKHYLEKQILDKNILQRAKKGSSTIKSVGNQVQSMSSIAKIESSPDSIWKFGTKSDLIRQKSKFWLNSDLFNSKAEVIYKGFSNVNYTVSVYKEIDLRNSEFIPFNNIHSSLDYIKNLNEFSSTIKTNINNNLDFSYKNTINANINAYSFNYHLGF